MPSANKESTKATMIDAVALARTTKHHPGRTGKGGRTFSADPMPPGFHTIVDPNKNPTQGWQDLPAPTGLAPFHLSLDSVLSAEAMATINNSGKLVFHCGGRYRWSEHSTQIENVAATWKKTLPGPTLRRTRRSFTTWAT